MADAVRATTGTWRVSGLARSRASASCPSMPGSWRSMRMRSGTVHLGLGDRRPRRSSPPSTVKPAYSRMSRVSLRFLSLSSTSRIRSALMGARRGRPGDPDQTLREDVEVERRLRGHESDPAVEPFAVVGFERLRGEDDHRDVGGLGAAGERLDDGEPVGLGHEQVDEDDRRSGGRDQLDRVGASLADLDGPALRLQGDPDELEGHRVVVDDDDGPAAGLAGRGRDDAPDGEDELLLVHRLDEVVGGAEREALAALRQHRDDDDRASRRCPGRTSPREDLPAAHARKLDVEDDGHRPQ